MGEKGGRGGEVSNTRGLILRGTRMDTHGTGGGVSDDVRECAWREEGGRETGPVTTKAGPQMFRPQIRRDEGVEGGGGRRLGGKKGRGETNVQMRARLLTVARARKNRGGMGVGARGEGGAVVSIGATRALGMGGEGGGGREEERERRGRGGRITMQIYLTRTNTSPSREQLVE